MPNHIKNRILVTGDINQVKEFANKYKTHHPAKLHKAYDGSIICEKQNEDGKKEYGWYDLSNGMFKTRDSDPVLGLPEGYEMEITAAYNHFPDFAKILPVPQELRNINPSEQIVSAVKRKYNTPLHSNGLIAILESNSRENAKTEFEGEEKEMFDKCCIAYEKTGFVYWYDWNLAHWGTKWNSYSCEEEYYNAFTFETAWSGVPDMILEMSKQNPELEIQYEYSDEDTGYNCGVYKFLNGEVIERFIPDGGSIEAYDIAFRLRPEHKQYYTLSDGKYMYNEDED